MAIEKPFFLKKLMIGPKTVEKNQAKILAIPCELPNFFSSSLSNFVCDLILFSKLLSFTNSNPRFNKTIIELRKIFENPFCNTTT